MRRHFLSFCVRRKLTGLKSSSSRKIVNSSFRAIVKIDVILPQFHSWNFIPSTPSTTLISTKHVLPSIGLNVYRPTSCLKRRYFKHKYGAVLTRPKSSLGRKSSRLFILRYSKNHRRDSSRCNSRNAHAFYRPFFSPSFKPIGHLSKDIFPILREFQINIIDQDIS